MRANENITTDTLNNLCNILDCDLCDIVKHIKD
ncbi:MAG: helix-turn-helix transcriptional regulator [Defluviitaleaceae bacterium]|nr:helix-turn-helix transcriptional regulator [Defluviitaleaceae bacterium]